MRKIFILSSVVLVVLASAQSTPVSQGNTSQYVPNVVSPSPSVANLMKFEEVPVNNYTGVPDISIPIASVSAPASDLPVNVSLKYHTYNAKSDSKAGEVGLGWSLIGAGSISRTVRGGIDEAVVGLENGSMLGMYFDQYVGNYPDQINYFNILVEAPAVSPVDVSKEIFDAHYKNKYDTQYDLYQYNFFNHTGRFVLKKNGNQLIVVKLDDNNLKIKANYSTDIGPLKAFEPLSFEITDDKGNLFIFDVLEKSQLSTFSNITAILEESTTTGSGNGQVNSAFHLRQINNSSGTVLANYTYTPITVVTSDVTNYYNMYMHPLYPIPAGQHDYRLRVPRLSELHISSKTSAAQALSGIEIVGIGNIALQYSSAREDTNYALSSAPPKLESVVISNLSNRSQEKYQFTYTYKQTGTSKRLFLTGIAKSVNMGTGYTFTSDQLLKYHEPEFTLFEPLIGGQNSFFSCGGADCSSFEVLKSITYPTKGAVEFSFAANTYSYEPDIANGSPNTIEITNFDENDLNWDKVSGYVHFDRFSNDIEKNAFTVLTTSNVTITNSTGTIDGNGWVLHVLKNGSIVYSYGAGFSAPGDPYPTEATFLLTPGVYTFRLVSAHYGSSNLRFNATFGFNFRQRNLQNYQYLVDNRGIRIQNIRYFETANNSAHPGNQPLPVKSKNYNYHDLNNPKKSTGSLVSPRPVFTYELGFSAKIKAQDGAEIYNDFINTIRYSSVNNFVQGQTTKGSDVGYKFVTVSESNNGKTVFEYTSPIDKPNPDLPSVLPPFIPAAYHDHLRGNLLSRKQYNNTGDLLTVDSYTYDYGVSSVNTGIIIHPSNYLYGDTHPTHAAFITWRQNYGSAFGLSQMANLNYSFTKEYIGTAHVINEHNISYFSNQPSVAQTKATTYNSRHYPIKNMVQNSDGSLHETSYKYAHEKFNTKLVNAHMIGIPLEMTVVKKKNGSDLTGKILTKIDKRYDDAIHNYATSVQSFDIQNQGLKTEITYDSYDSRGNIQQYTPANGIPVALIWGYNQTQPIAKVEGAVLGLIPLHLISQIVTKSDEDNLWGTPLSEQELVDALDVFRKAVYALNRINVQVSTYTYDPLVGVRTITPPSGIRESYIYDTANRLQKIVDINGKIVKEFKYNYKQ